MSYHEVLELDRNVLLGASTPGHSQQQSWTHSLGPEFHKTHTVSGFMLRSVS